MVYISKTVGRGAFNAKHDVAVVQAALKNVKIGNKPAWAGTIHGWKNNVLEQAIVAFQDSKGIKATGKVAPRGLTIRALNSDLPRALVNMRGLKGTCAVFVSPLGAREADREARKAKSEAPFPDKESAGLATIITNVGRAFGICLERKREFVTQDGRFAVEMDFMQVRWIGNGNGMLLPAGRESSGATQSVCSLIQSVPDWAVSSDRDLVFTSNRHFPPLKRIGPATAADLKALGLTQLPENEVLQAMVAACARLVGSGDILTKNSQVEHKLLVEAVSNVDKDLATRLDNAAETYLQLNVSLGNLGFQADALLVDVTEAIDALAIRSKELGVIATFHINVAKAHFLSAIALLAAREIPATIKHARDGLKFLEAADVTLISGHTATNLSHELADKSKALGLICAEMSAVIDRREKLCRA